MIPVSKNLNPETKRALDKGESMLNADQRTLNMPVNVRGQVIAMMRLTKATDSDPWLPDEIADVELLSNQISNALDGARLYSDVQRRAALEQAVGEISSKIGAKTKIDAIMRSTVQELGRQISGAKIAVELSTETEQEES